MKKLVILFICLLLCSCTGPVFKMVVIEDDEPQVSKLSLTFVGDALLHTPIIKDAYEDGRYNFAKMFESVGSVLEGSDLAFYNQESILGGESLGYSGHPTFNTPDEFGRTMLALGFNLVNSANNHTLDMGEAGILNSCNFWNRYSGVLTSGSVCTPFELESPRILEMNGIKYAMLGYTLSTNGLKSPNDYYVSIYSDERARREINALRSEVDLLLVSMHWGNEYTSNPTLEQIRISKYLASLGVDVVIGTHPHVISPLRWIGKTLVIYSLGHFISNQSDIQESSRRIGLAVHLDVLKTSFQDKKKITLEGVNTELLYTKSENGKNFQVLPFSKLDDSILPGYNALKMKYDAIVKKYDNIDTN